MASAEEHEEAPPNILPPFHRFITTHEPSTGKAVFSKALPEEAPGVLLPPPSAQFALMYTSNGWPAQLNGDKDLETYTNFLANPPGITISSGVLCRVVDMFPGALSPMHRTVSLDYGVVIEGEIELVLDSGEVRHMKRGDTAIQRGTNHAWKNVTPKDMGNGWARMFFVLMPSEPVEVAGKALEEDYGTMKGVQKST